MKRVHFQLRHFLLVLLFLVAVAGAGYAWLAHGLPDPGSLASRLNPPSIRITDRNGRLLYEALHQEGGRNAVVPLESMPLHLRQATIATEDRNFYINPGVDPEGILRALWINLQGGESFAGGSTITQQVARNLLMSAEERSERSLLRKLREAVLAWRLTLRYTKDEILALYLNQTYYGGMAYGVEAAAQTYFGKPAAALDLAESALIAGLPQAPALYNPFTDPQAAKERQLTVLLLMEEDGMITDEQRLLAEREQLALSATPYPMEAPHFVLWVREQLDAIFSPEAVYASGGLVVRSSLDLDWQRHASEAVRRQIEAMQESADGIGHNLNNAALVALNPRSGEVLAMVGSRDYFDAEHDGAINMTLARRQPGSALKPLIYAYALDPANARPWSAATMLLDASTSFQTHDGKAYIPSNYDLREHGPVLLRDALGSSLNIPAVLALQHVGLEKLFAFGQRLGLTTLHNPDQYDLSLALGGGEVRLLELTAAYGAFANGGMKVTPQAILDVRNFSGEILFQAQQPPETRVLDERVAWLISDILSDPEARLLGFGPNTVLQLDRPAAVKTGTTSNFHDNWTVGYTPSLVVGVWAGNTDYQPMRDVNGLAGAAPIWHSFMRTVLAGTPPEAFRRPAGLVQAEVCSFSGLLPTDACPYRRIEWFVNGTQPTTPDTFYREVKLDRLTGQLAGPDTPPERWVNQLALDLPPQAWPWARQAGLTLLRDLQAGSASAQAALTEYPVPGNPLDGQAGVDRPPLQMISPPAGSIFHLSTGFSAQAQRIALEAVGEGELQEVSLWLDGELMQTFFGSGPYRIFWTLTQGVHQAWAEGVRSNGERMTSATISFEVK